MGPISAVLPLMLVTALPAGGLPHGAPETQRGAPGGLYVRAVHPDPVRTLGLDALARERGGGPAPPACVAGACGASLTLPGGVVAPGLPARRGELILALLAHSPIEPLAALAARAAESNLRVEYAPARVGGETRGWGQVVLSLRFRLDANGPAAELPPRGGP